MEVDTAIKSRRSIRKFTTDKIDKNVVFDILEAGRLAPSAKNRQPWYFVVLSEEIKDEVADYMINLKQDIGKEGDNGYSSSISFSGQVVKTAPVAILIFTTFDDSYLISDTMSVGACIENMILKALDFSLGSLWVRDIIHIEDKVYDLLNIHDKKLSSLLLLGVPAQFPKQRPRKELNDITMWL